MANKKIVRDKNGNIISVYGDLFYHKNKAYEPGTVIKEKVFNRVECSTYMGKTNGMDGWMDERGNIQYYYPYFIIEIVKPVEYIEPPVIYRKITLWDFILSKPHPAHIEEVFYGWILYITIMLLALIFKDRVLIWIVTSILFFGWKYSK